MRSTVARVALAMLLAGGMPLAAAGGAKLGLPLGPTVQGRASADGRALAAAEVRLVPFAALRAEPKVDPVEWGAPVATARTGADGSFLLTAPSPGPWGVRIDSPGRVGREIAIEVLEGTVRLPPVELPGARDLEVRVLDPELETGLARVAWPSGRRVDAFPLNRWRAIAVVARFGAGGTATVPVAADGEGEVQVVAPGFQIVRTEARGSLAVVELTRVPAAEVRVLDAASSPLAGVRIFDGGGPLPAAVTDRDGRARLRVPPDRAGSAEAGSEARAVTLLAPNGSFTRAAFPTIEGGSGTFRFDPPRRISGRVLERGTGRPLEEAVVWSRPLWPGSLAHSDRDGAFELCVPGRSGATLVVAAAGHRTELVAVDAGRAVEVNLEARRRAVGWVVDQEDRPVAGAEVRLTAVRDGDSSSPPPSLGPFTTGADGSFEVPGPPSGRFALKVEADGFGSVTVPGVEVPVEVADVDLGVVALSAGLTLAGRVLDELGGPVEKARILMAPAGTEPWEGTLAMETLPREVLTDAEGAFSFADLSYGATVRLQARKEGFVSSEARALAVEEEGAVEIVLTRPATVSGWVVDSSGRPIGGALVTVASPSEGGLREETRGAAFPTAEARSGWTGPDGDFEIRDLNPGRHSVRASAAGYRQGAGRTVDVEAGDELPGIEIVLEEGATLEGRVVSVDGIPAAGATVDLVDADGRSVAFGRVDTDGGFRFTGLAPGAYTLAAVAADGRRVRRRVDFGAQQQEVTLVLDGGVRVQGRVVRSDGSPVAGARVLLTRFRSTGATTETRTDPAGGFAWSAVEPGVYHLGASAEGLSPARGVALSVEEEPLDDLELVLGEGVTLRGQVLGVAFADLPAVRVRVLGVPGAVARLDHAGGFVLHHLPEGEIVLVAELETAGRRTAERLELPAGAWEVEASLWLPERSPGAD